MTPPSPPSEGYIKFLLEHREEELSARRFGEPVASLVGWRALLWFTGLVGRDPERYEGLGYGNVSVRVGPPSAALGRRSFLISGTQTSGRERVGLEDFALVERYDYRANRVVSQGAARPSSESMTHGAAYDLGPHIRSVLHAHSPVVWRQARRLRMPTTDPRVAYGTPEMALEVRRLYRESVLPERQLLVMGGHEDGVLAFGRSPDEAGQTLLTWLARAYRAEFEGG